MRQMRRVSPWFRTMAGIGWKCLECERYNSYYGKPVCSKCQARRPTAEEYAAAKEAEQQESHTDVAEAAIEEKE